MSTSMHKWSSKPQAMCLVVAIHQPRLLDAVRCGPGSHRPPHVPSAAGTRILGHGNPTAPPPCLPRKPRAAGTVGTSLSEADVWDSDPTAPEACFDAVAAAAVAAAEMAVPDLTLSKREVALGAAAAPCCCPPGGAEDGPPEPWPAGAAKCRARRTAPATLLLLLLLQEAPG